MSFYETDITLIVFAKEYDRKWAGIFFFLGERPIKISSKSWFFLGIPFPYTLFLKKIETVQASIS